MNICKNGSWEEAKKRLEIHAISILNEEHYSVTKIAKAVNRIRKVTINLLKDPDNYGDRKSCGRPQCLTARDKHAIISQERQIRACETNCRRS